MCNIAGYIGERPAAAVLLDMIRREEGFGGGYYTGIATIHEGRIYYAKLTGDTKKLIEETEAANLPGTVGIIHSRSKSGGGDEWAHPFVGRKNGTEQIAYVANGSAGYFAPRIPEYNKMANELVGAGYEMLSSVRLEDNRYQKLSDGSSVHMSDVMCQKILQKMDEQLAEAGSLDTPKAMSDAFCEMPSEIVGLMLALNEPDSIIWSRINFPMFVGFANGEAYLATTALAFPEGTTQPVLLPALSGGRVTKDGYSVTPYINPPVTVAPIDSVVHRSAYTMIEKELSLPETLNGKGKSISALCKTIRPAFAPAECYPESALVYDILYDMKKQDLIEVHSFLESGAFPELLAPRFYVKAVNKTVQIGENL